MIKYFFILMLCFGFHKSEPVKLLKATSQAWTGGTSQSGRGVDYNFELLALQSSEKISFRGIWIKDTYYSAKVYVKGNYTKENVFQKNDTLVIKISESLNIKNETTGSEQVSPPYKTASDAIMGYTFKSKTIYLEVPKFEMLKPLLYPSKK